MTHTFKTQPKHSRLFELIRQKNHADHVVARIETGRNGAIHANELIKLQKAATRSLQAQI